MLQFGTFLTYWCTLWDPDPPLVGLDGPLKHLDYNSLQLGSLTLHVGMHRHCGILLELPGLLLVLTGNSYS